MFIYAILFLASALALAPPANLEQELYSALDANKNGQVTQLETETYFLTYDTNGNGEITKQEFTASVDKVDPAFVGHEDLLFKLFDRNSDNQVDKSDIDAVFKLADINKDNEVSKHEFSVIFATVISQVG